MEDDQVFKRGEDKEDANCGSDEFFVARAAEFAAAGIELSLADEAFLLAAEWDALSMEQRAPYAAESARAERESDARGDFEWSAVSEMRERRLHRYVERACAGTFTATEWQRKFCNSEQQKRVCNWLLGCSCAICSKTKESERHSTFHSMHRVESHVNYGP